jgi:hypothetical protein
MPCRRCLPDGIPAECAEQIFSRYYADRIAAHIVEERPVIKQVFEQWKGSGPEAFASALEKNIGLKSALLAGNALGGERARRPRTEGAHRPALRP